MKYLICIIVLVTAHCVSAENVIFLNDKSDATKNYPFSKATQVGDILFLSGELGIDPKTGKLAEGGIEAESKQLMINISNTLGKYNSSLDKVAKCQVFLADIKDWPKFNAIYRTFFNKGKIPARSAMAVSGLALSAKIEVECIAVVNLKTEQ
jgi:reactive intermediate/imine deaminase